MSIFRLSGVKVLTSSLTQWGMGVFMSNYSLFVIVIEQVMVRLKREHQFSSVGDGKGYRQSDNPPTAGGAAVPKGSREVLIALV